MGLKRALHAALVLISLGGAVTGIPAQASAAPRPEQWWFTAWGIQPKVWPITKGKGVTVAVLDTGVNAKLADLAGAVVPGADTTGGDTNGLTDTDTDPESNGHGTTMAALIVGQGRRTGFLGVAPEAKVMPVRIRGGGADSQYVTALPAGIRYAADHGAKVVNISSGNAAQAYPNHCSPEIQQAVTYAIQRDVVVVAAAGNDGTGANAPQMPAACKGVLAVGAFTTTLAAWSKTQRQGYVDAAAPGGQVGSVGRDGRFMNDISGTSQAAALTSGAVALVRAKYPNLKAADVVRRIMASTRDAGPRGRDNATGYGAVRPYYALTGGGSAVGNWAVVAQIKELAAANTGGAAASPTASPPPSNWNRGGQWDGPILIGFGVLVLAGIVVISLFLMRRRGRPRGPVGPHGGPEQWQGGPGGPPSFGQPHPQTPPRPHPQARPQFHPPYSEGSAAQSGPAGRPRSGPTPPGPDS
jgi:type VII secretion-associated serine protease mycosin